MRATEPPTDELARFTSEFDRLIQHLWAWSPSRWDEFRVAAARSFALTLVRLAEVAGAGPPVGVELPIVAAYGIADQLAVLGREVLDAPHRERAVEQALTHLAAARAALG